MKCMINLKLKTTTYTLINYDKFKPNLQNQNENYTLNFTWFWVMYNLYNEQKILV